MKHPLVKYLLLIAVLLWDVPAFSEEADTVKRRPISTGITVSQIPQVFQGMRRYFVTTDYTEKWHNHAINRTIQIYLPDSVLSRNTMAQNVTYLRTTAAGKDYRIDLATDKELFYGIWRAKLITIQNESDLKDLMDYGTRYLMDKGYSLKEILPFISLLLQEHTDYHYDNTRTKFFGENSGGYYSFVDLLTNYQNFARPQPLGVCRDIHEAGLRMVREIAGTYYSTLYPEKNINVDDYLFLVSWCTQSSQHVTISFTDPLDTKKTYELDWGRFIEKTNNVGYEHGRNYGNTYRVWKFDPSQNKVRPIDSKRTNVGNFFDDRFYTAEEFDAFAGIKNIEPYSQAFFDSPLKKNFHISTSFGTLSQDQRFIQYTLSYRPKEKALGKYFTYRGAAGFQNMYMEEHEKKNLLFPINNYKMYSVLYLFPRYLAEFRTRDYKIGKYISTGFYSANTIEFLGHFNDYQLRNSSQNDPVSQSADGGIMLTQGYRISCFAADSVLGGSLKIQNRGFLVPDDIRLMSPNPVALLGNAVMVSPARDIILELQGKIKNLLSVRTKSVLEYTNQKNIIVYQEGNITATLGNKGSLTLLGNWCKNVKGIPYFWYPVNRSKAELGYRDRKGRIYAGGNVQIFGKDDVVYGCNLMFMLR